MGNSDATTAANILKQFINPSQLQTMIDNCKGEEKDFFISKLKEIADLIANMSETYEQDGKGDDAIVYLHYFMGGMDWHIIEKDSDPDGDGQIQAFGLANLGHGAELGYISIAELLENNIELDLFFEPITLGKLKQTVTV